MYKGIQQDQGIGQMNGRCCVFQPFDRGAYDKRYADILEPAIADADLEPYRVDRDDGVVIPIDTLHEEIKAATICLADIGTLNANVMYELGFAIASGKDVIIISPSQAAKFPFDIQHRGIISYASDSPSDFTKLRKDITARIKALVKKQHATQTIENVSPVKSTEGLQPHEFAALALVMATVNGPYDQVGSWSIKEDMRKTGYTNIAASLALAKLTRMNFLEALDQRDDNNEHYIAYRILSTGEDWLLNNQDLLELRTTPKPSARAKKTDPFDLVIMEDDVPF